MEKVICKEIDGSVCKHYSETGNAWRCNGDIRNINFMCLQRRIVMLLLQMVAPSPLKAKVEKMIDDVGKEMKEGEEWKG